MFPSLTSDPPRPQIPARCSWSGSRGHPRGVGGPGSRWGAHRPHPALWHTPVPGPVAQPALQTRRDQRAPHRAITGIQTRRPTPWCSATNKSTDHQGPRDSETAQPRLPVEAARKQEHMFWGICTFNLLVLTPSLRVQYQRNFFFFFLSLLFWDTPMSADAESAGF